MTVDEAHRLVVELSDAQASGRESFADQALVDAFDRADAATQQRMDDRRRRLHQQRLRDGLHDGRRRNAVRPRLRQAARVPLTPRLPLRDHGQPHRARADAERDTESSWALNA